MDIADACLIFPRDVIQQALALGRLISPAILCVRQATNTEVLYENEARRVCNEAA